MNRHLSHGRFSTSLAASIAAAVVLALVVFKFMGGGPDLKDVVGNMAKKMELISGMRVNLLKSEEAEKSAVMADTDEASTDFANQSRRAADFVERDRRQLETLLAKDHTDQEMKIFREFDTCWPELQKIDREVLAFAVQNTNLKAAALSFGKGNEALNRIQEALQTLIHADGPCEHCGAVVVPASDALAAVLRIQTLLAPHIVSSSDAKMDEMEGEIRRNEETVEASLKRLAASVPEAERTSLREAKTAYDEFAGVTAEVIKLSRENTNIKSFELSLGNKRKLAARCDETLTGLQEAVRSREFKATR